MGVSEVTSGIIITTAVIAIVIITVGVLATMIAIAKKANKKQDIKELRSPSSSSPSPSPSPFSCHFPHSIPFFFFVLFSSSS